MRPWTTTWTRDPASVCSPAKTYQAIGATDLLASHAGRCDCSTWEEFHNDTRVYLKQFPSSWWRSWDPTTGAPLPDHPGYLTFTSVLKAVHTADRGIRQADEPAALTQALALRYERGVLAVESTVAGTAHRACFERLDGPQEIVAFFVSNRGLVPEGSTPAHHVRSYERDIVHTAAELLAWAGLGPLPTADPFPGIDILADLAAIKAAGPAGVWDTVVRLAHRWTGTIDDLTRSATAITQAAS